MSPIRVAAALLLLLATAPAAAAADDFAPGEYEGTTAQGRTVKFAADATGVHLFKARLTLTCRDGDKRKTRISVPHIHMDLEASGGRFRYARTPRSRHVLRVTGTLAGTAATGTVSRRKGSCRSGTRTWTAVHSGAADGHHHHHGADPALQVGNHAPYPSLELASPAKRRRADALRVATNQAAASFATVARAQAAGYVADPAITPVYVPGIVHYRKNGVHFWGRVLDPRRPQALIFWCPSVGECALVAAMYRAPAASRPPTYGGLIGWHRHGRHGTWMTHIWLTDTLAPALAQCVPFNALSARNPRVVYERYRVDVPGIDAPCPDTIGLAAP
jgi:hypothetical protein